MVFLNPAGSKNHESDRWVNKMEETKQKHILPVIITVATAGFPIIMGSGHCCHRNSNIASVLLLVVVITACCFWTAHAKTRGKAWLRTVLAFVIAIIMQLSYLQWLHSPSFPKVLLSRQSLEKEAQIQKMIQERTTQPVFERDSRAQRHSNALK